MNFKIDSDVSEETLQELVEIAERHFPVANTITNATPVNVSFVWKDRKM